MGKYWPFFDRGKMFEHAGENLRRLMAERGLSVEGTIEAAREMNHKRELHDKLAVLLESSQQQLVREILESLYRQVTSAG